MDSDTFVESRLCEQVLRRTDTAKYNSTVPGPMVEEQTLHYYIFVFCTLYTSIRSLKSSLEHMARSNTNKDQQNYRMAQTDCRSCDVRYWLINHECTSSNCP